MKILKLINLLFGQPCLQERKKNLKRNKTDSYNPQDIYGSAIKKNKNPEIPTSHLLPKSLPKYNKKIPKIRAKFIFKETRKR
jgi:hypothetical protein